MSAQPLRATNHTDRRSVGINTLVLDDQAFERSRIKRLAKRSKLRLNITEAPSIEAMSQAMKNNSFDLFLVDYKLPQGDGLQAVDMIRSQPANKNAALIMITGHEACDLAVSAFRQGCNDLIVKHDLSPSLFGERIRAALYPALQDPGSHLFEEEKLRRRLRDATLRCDVRDEMTEGLRRAVRQAEFDPEQAKLHQVKQFLQDFLQNDEFRFK